MTHAIYCPKCGLHLFTLENPRNNPFEMCFPCPQCFAGPKVVYGRVPPPGPEPLYAVVETLGPTHPAPLQEEKPAA